MRKVSKILAASGLIIVSLGMFGCQPGTPQQAPEVVLQNGLNKLADLTSYGYDVNLVGDLKAPEGETPAAINFNFGLKGGVDMKDSKDPKLNVNLKGSFSGDADGGSGEVSLKLNKEAIFLNLMSLAGKGSVTIPEELKTQYVGKWWTMPLPPAALDELTKVAPGGDAATMTEDQKKMKALVEETKFFKNAKYVDNADVAGESSFHYTSELDKEAFIAFVIKSSELQGTTMSDTEQKDLKDSLANIDLSGDLYVGKTSGTLNRAKGAFTFKPNADKPAPVGTVTFDVTVSDMNKSVTVDAPKDAQPVPPELLGSLPL